MKFGNIYHACDSKGRALCGRNPAESFRLVGARPCKDCKKKGGDNPGAYKWPHITSATVFMITSELVPTFTERN